MNNNPTKPNIIILPNIKGNIGIVFTEMSNLDIIKDIKKISRVKNIEPIKNLSLKRIFI